MATRDEQTAALQSLLDTLRGEFPVDGLRQIVIAVDWPGRCATVQYTALKRDATGHATLNAAGTGPEEISGGVDLPHLATVRRITAS